MLLLHPLYSHSIFKPLYTEIIRMIESITGGVIDIKNFNPHRSYNSLNYDSKLFWDHINATNKQTIKTVKKFNNGKLYMRTNVDDGMLPIFKITQTGLKIDLPYETARLFLNQKGMYMRMIEPPNQSSVATDSVRPFLPRLTQIQKNHKSTYKFDDINSIVYPMNRILECYCF